MSLITVLYILIGLQLHRSTVGPSRGNSVKLKHRVYKPVVTYGNSPAQAVLVLNEVGNEKPTQSNQDEDGRKNFAKNAQAAKHVVKMLVAVVVLFFICWAPFHAQRLLAIYGERSSSKTIKAYQTLTYISGVLYYLSTTVNPLLYNIMSHKFREAFKNTFKQCFRRRILMNGDPRGGRCYATLSGRSSQVNSHSNTDSYSKQSSLRYLDAEMARLHDSRRPLVVAFRRKATQTSPYRSRRADLSDQTFEIELPEIRDERVNETVKNGLEKNISILDDKIADSPLAPDLTYVEVHNLQPTHICPLSINQLESTERLKIENFITRYRRHQSNSLSSEIKTDTNLFKSCTVPDIAKMRSSMMESGRTKNSQNRMHFNEKEECVINQPDSYKCVSSIVFESSDLHVN